MEPNGSKWALLLSGSRASVQHMSGGTVSIGFHDICWSLKELTFKVRWKAPKVAGIESELSPWLVGSGTVRCYRVASASSFWSRLRARQWSMAVAWWRGFALLLWVIRLHSGGGGDRLPAPSRPGVCKGATTWGS